MDSSFAMDEGGGSFNKLVDKMASYQSGRDLFGWMHKKTLIFSPAKGR